MRHASVKLSLAVVGLLMASFPGFSQSIRVSSGEHGDFSRLVIAFRQKVEWSFGRVQGGYELRTNAEQATFRLAKVFDLIPRDRIASVRDLGEGRLFLEVPCACFADAFELSRGQIVLDIKDGAAAGEAGKFNQALPALKDESPAVSVDLQQSQTGAQVDFDGAPQRSKTNAAGMAGPNQTVDTPVVKSAYESRQGLPLLPQGITSPQVSAEPDSVPPGEKNQPGSGVQESPVEPSVDSIAHAPSEPERVGETEQELLVQISRGAAQGLLEANVTVPKSPGPETPAPTEVPNMPTAIELEVLPETPESHVVIQTAIDREKPVEAQPKGITQQGLQCPSEEAFSVPLWGEDIQKGVDLAPFRSGLLGEFDITRVEAVEKLAKFYIFLSFGAEATELLERYEGEVENSTYLRIMAEIMDGRTSPNSRVIAPFVECDGSAAMWAILAQDTIDTAFQVNRAAVRTSFSELPPHLRRYLGPTLISRLLEVGESDLAHALRNALTRGETEPQANVTLSEARLLVDEGKVEQAAIILANLVQNNAGSSSEIIRELVALKLSQRIPITKQEVALIASFAFEQRGTEPGKILQTLEIKAMAQTGQFKEAIGRMAELEKREELSQSIKEELQSDLAYYLVTKGTDSQFLRYLVPIAEEIHLDGETRFAVAQRFFDLGFVAEARLVLRSSASVPDPAERRLLAKLALTQEKYNVAMGYLAGLDDPDSMLLRAEVLIGKQETSAALDIYEKIGETERLLNLSWRAGLWQETATRAGGELGAIGALLTNEPNGAPKNGDSTSELAVDVEMLDRSAQTRTAISELFQRFPSP